ncbi:S9 family peptidase [Kineosporia sp. J2-2]|uniref:S9 family peptidase n=1 Tax=Kineosporia corallincola TaxID=2835133 RepID=A0ABS5TK00_9ACTN|nr:S9 family peptidase [Kineosporia corallincola]MBT0771340.1 S9 family peptidase [Kineosporia corallincola]
MNPDFTDLDALLELPRVAGLALSPDGTRLVTSVAALGPQRTSYVSSLWQVSPDPEGPSARRLTWGAQNESGPVFRPDGDLLFVSSRPDPDDDGGDRPPSLWLLPADGGEARPFATRPGGVSSTAVAAGAGTVVITSPVFPSSTGTGDDERRHRARRELKISATLHESSPFRFWDRFHGPEADRLFVLSQTGDGEPAARDLTGHTGPALHPDPEYVVTPDGTTVIGVWQVVGAGGQVRSTLVTIDVATGTRRTLLDDRTSEFSGLAVSPDGTRVAFLAESLPTVDEPFDLRLMVLNLDGGEPHEAAPGWDRWPAAAPVWTPDGGTLLVTADDHGRRPVFRVDLTLGTVRRLTGEGTFTDLLLARDGTVAYALRSTVDVPPTPVRIDPLTGEVTTLRGPVSAPAVPGTLTEVHVTAEDGYDVRGWLVLPAGHEDGRPAPLLLWVHGGPHDSWRAWHWRWNPWPAVARGYAVLLPDPALSTGYGLDFVRRGWDGWGGTPYTDLMAITDAVVARDDIDGERTAAMGASYGGYLANWIAGHTGRFRGIVSHAGLWDLETFARTTDVPYYMPHTMTAETRAQNSPSRHLASITTPMLIIHGEQDHRVPIGEALAMYTQLGEQAVTDDGTMPHRLLVFPDENHWVAKPQNSRLWYETVFAFLAQTLLGEPWQAPDLLR